MGSYTSCSTSVSLSDHLKESITEIRKADPDLSATQAVELLHKRLIDKRANMLANVSTEAVKSSEEVSDMSKDTTEEVSKEVADIDKDITEVSNFKKNFLRQEGVMGNRVTGKGKLTTSVNLQGLSVDQLVKIKSDKKSLSNISEEVLKKGNEDRLIKALQEIGLDEKQSKYVSKHFTTFKKRYAKVATADKSKKPDDVFLIQKPLSIFQKTVGDVEALPLHFQLAMSIALKQFEEDINGTGAMSVKSMADFLFNDNKAPLEAFEIEALTMGTGYSQSAAQVGRNVQKLLGMSPNTSKENALETNEGLKAWFDKFGSAAGMAALEVNNVFASEVNKDKQHKYIIVAKFFDFVIGNPTAQQYVNDHPTVKNAYVTYYKAYRKYYNTPLGSGESQRLFKTAKNAGRVFIKEVRKHNDQFEERYSFKTGYTMPQITANPVFFGKDADGNKVAVNPSQREFYTNPNKHDKDTTILDVGKKLGTVRLPNSEILTKPNEEPLQFLKHNYSAPPKKIQKVGRKLHNIAWTKASAMSLFKGLNDVNRDVLNLIAGDKKIIDGVDHKDVVIIKTASNEAKQKEINNILQALEDGTLNDPIYMKYGMASNMRLMMQGLINPQNSKIARILFKPHEAITYNEDNMYLFQAAVVQRLNQNDDKKTPKEVKAEFNRLIALKIKLPTESVKLMDIAKGLNAIQQGNTTEEYNRKIYTRLAEILPHMMGDNTLKNDNLIENLSILDGLSGLASYYDYHVNGKDFQSDIGIEIDGVTNGLAIGLMQFPMGKFSKVKNLFNATATFFTRNIKDARMWESGFFKKNPRTDMYRVTGNVIASAKAKSVPMFIAYKRREVSKKEVQGYIRKSDALDKLLFNNDTLFNPRNFAKYPLMIFLYGAGIVKISYSVAKANIIKEVVLPAIGTMQAEYNSLDAKAQANYINNTVLPFQENIQAFSVKPKDFLLAKNIRLNTAPQMDIHTEHLAIEMGKVLEPRIN
ncbi:MAG: hypothetical protein U9O94_05870, partial [Nanoarchaeota archaeon]|nr:hypothetical protein [Nanoarchaeota archaeon]